MRAIPKQIVKIAQQLKDGEPSRRHKVRGVLNWFGASRRGANVLSDIRTVLANFGLETDPPLDGAKIDARVRFRLSSASTAHTDPSPVAPAGTSSFGAGQDISSPKGSNGN